MTRDVARMARTCKIVKKLLENLYEDYGVFDVSPYEHNKNIHMTEEALFNMFPARMIEKDELYSNDIDELYNKYFAEADGLKFFCLKKRKNVNNPARS